MRKGVSFRNKIFLAMALTVAGVVSLTILVVNGIVRGQASETISDDLAHSLTVYEAIRKEQVKNLAARIENTSEAPRLKAALDTRRQDQATVADLAGDLRDGFGLFQIVDKRGRMLVSFTADSPAAAVPAKSPAPYDGVFAASIKPDNPRALAGVMVQEGELYLTVTGPVIIGERVVGGLRAGQKITDASAAELRDETGSEVAFVVGGDAVAASSLSPSARNGVALWLGGLSAGDKESAASSNPARVFTLRLDRMPYFVRLSPLADPFGKSIGYQVQLRSRAQVLDLISRVRGGVIAIGVTGMVVALLLAFLISRGITRPLTDLMKGTSMVEQGNFDYRIKVKTADELGALATSFNDMLGQLKEKERVKALFGRYLSRAVAERALAQQGEIQLGGEQREVTILFSDIRGFTALSENIPPHEVVAMLNGYFTKMVDIIMEHDGTVDKYVGDAIMAIFGAPVADEKSPSNAVSAAIDMMDALKLFNFDRIDAHRSPIEIGIGINSGVVIAGNLGSIKQVSYTVIGEEVNLASRICAHAGKGQILVSESTHRRTKWEFEFGAPENITVKNVSHPVEVFEVTGRRNAGKPAPSQEEPEQA